MTGRIYLDYAATAPIRPEALKAMVPHLTEQFGNANALYLEGKQARLALEAARQTVAKTVSAAAQEITFCSGGTEAANSIVAGIVNAVRASKGEKRGGNHIVCAAFEHHAVLDSVNALKRNGYEVTLVNPQKDGRVRPEDLVAAMRLDTMLVAVMYAQNELGTVQPIEELAAIAHQYDAYFYTDAVQALGKVPIQLALSGIDAASFSAHKVGGPKGVGAFFLRRGTPFAATQLGGGQESGRRSGTQNVAGAVGFAAALALLTPEALTGEATRLAKLRDQLLQDLVSRTIRISATVPIQAGDTTGHLPGVLHLLVHGIESQTLILRLDEAGIAVSGGSACSTGSLEPSHVLTSMGIDKDTAQGALRISLGHGTTPQHTAALATALLDILVSYQAWN
jgi:cysteine desulfurase